MVSKDKKRVTVTIPLELYNHYENKSKETGLSKSVLMVIDLHEFLREQKK